MLKAVNGRYWHDDAEIGKNEYDALVAAVMEKNAWTSRVYSGAASIDEVPAEWREEIAERVKQRREEDKQPKDLEPDEALEIILGGGEA